MRLNLCIWTTRVLISTFRTCWLPLVCDVPRKRRYWAVSRLRLKSHCIVKAFDQLCVLGQRTNLVSLAAEQQYLLSI